jgi:hypothetical protein
MFNSSVIKEQNSAIPERSLRENTRAGFEFSGVTSDVYHAAETGMGNKAINTRYKTGGCECGLYSPFIRTMMTA